METFKTGKLAQWKNSGAGEILEFPAPTGSRKCFVEFICDEFVSIFVKDDTVSDSVLVAFQNGKFSVEFSTYGTAFLEIHCDTETVVFFRTTVDDVRVRASSDKTFTSVEPMRQRRSELDNIQRLMARNEQRRNRMLSEERAELAKQRMELLKEVREMKKVKEGKEQRREARQANDTETSTQVAE